MNESELIDRAGLTYTWVDSFIQESNAIDPQAGDRSYNSPAVLWHREALLYCVQTGMEDRYALPKEVHRLLLRDWQAGQLRTERAQIGIREMLPPAEVPRRFWQWNQRVYATIDALRSDDVTTDGKYAYLWDLHYELMNIRPFQKYNGKVGRLLLVNHALLVDVEPWIIPCEKGREDYLDEIRRHPSSRWASCPSQLDELRAWEMRAELAQLASVRNK